MYNRGHFHGILRLRGVYPERAKRVEWASLRMTMLEVTHLSFPTLRLDLDVDRDCLADSGH
jgi:hypothetical protein